MRAPEPPLLCHDMACMAMALWQRKQKQWGPATIMASEGWANDVQGS